MGLKIIRTFSWFGSGRPKMERLIGLRRQAGPERSWEGWSFLMDVLIGLSVYVDDDTWDRCLRSAAVEDRRFYGKPALDMENPNG